MDPSTFETMREEQLQQRESVDVTNAAHILGKTLGVPVDGVPSFMKRPDIPGLPKQQEGIPPDHDCTICAATAACGFFNEAQKNGGNNPLMRRLQAVQELTKSDPDLLKGPDAENLIRERMDMLKTQPSPVPESSPEPIKKIVPKPAEITSPEPIQVIKEKPVTREPKVAEQTPITTPQRSETGRPDLKSTVTRFEETVHIPKTVVEDHTPEPKSQIAVSAEQVKTATSQTEVHSQSVEQQIQLTPQTGNEPITQEKAVQEKQPAQVKSIKIEKPTPKETTVSGLTVSLESQSAEKKPKTQPAVEPTIHIKENAPLSETPAEIKETFPPKPASTEREEDQPSIVVPSTNETVTPAQGIPEKPPSPVNFSKQDASELIPQPVGDQKEQTPSEQPAVGFVPTSTESIPSIQPPFVKKPNEQPVPIMAETNSKSEPENLPHPDTVPQPIQGLESVFFIPDGPVLDPHKVSVEPKAAETPAPVDTQGQPAIESAYDSEQSVLKENSLSEVYEDEYIPNLHSPEITVSFTGESPADESPKSEIGSDLDAPTISVPIDDEMTAQQTETSEIPISNTLIENLTGDDPSLEYFTEEVIDTDEDILSPSVTDVPDFIDTAENIVIAEDQTITLFSYDDVPKTENEQTPTQEKTTTDVPYLPLESVDFTQLLKDAEELHQDDDIEGTPDLMEATPEALEPDNVSTDSTPDTPLSPEITHKSSFPEPFPLILETEQEVIDQIFKGIEQQELESPPLVVMALPTMEAEKTDRVSNSSAEAEIGPASSTEILVFVWNPSQIEELSELSDAIFEVLEELEMADEEMTGLFDAVFDRTPEVVDEELKNDTFGKYDDTVVLLWYILKIFSLFGQAMLYINPDAIKEIITNPSHNIGFPRLSDSEAHTDR